MMSIDATVGMSLQSEIHFIYQMSEWKSSRIKAKGAGH